jgi:hypothetical protein
MASVIRIKRSGSTGAPSGLASGELAYSALSGTQSNGGDRLYIGFGTPETAGIAPNMFVIGGKYFTDMLDHVSGTLTASSALIVDASSKLDNLKVDNLDLNGNTISTTNTNGDLLITPNGTGKTVITNLHIGDASTSLAEFIYDTVGGAITGGTGITVINSDAANTSTISIDSTVATLTGTQALTNKTINGLTVTSTTGTLTIANGKTLTANNTLTFTGTDASSVAFGAGGTVAYTSNNLSVFAATSSDQLRGVISDETGTGLLVFATSPSLTTPVLGVATATSITATSGNLTLAAASGNNSIALTPTGTGTVDVSSKRITSLADPTQAQDAATKSYVDSLSNGLDVKASVRAASTANLTATYNNGSSGVGATLTNSGTQAALTLDSIALQVGNRVLIKDQTTALQNGVYVVTTVGTISTNWVLTRATDFDNSPGIEVSPGVFFFVEEGTTQQDNGYVVSTDGAITIGTTAIVFSQFSGAGQITAGDGLTKTGNTINAVGTLNRISVTADSIDIASTYVGQTSITTLGTIGTGTWQGSVVAGQYGGTGVANTGKTITIGGNFTTSGAHTTTLTTTGNTSVTLPTTGTLATLAGTESLSNKTITASSFSGTTITASGLITFTNATDATNLTTAAVVLSGGLAVTKQLRVGTNLTGAGASTSTLDGFNIDGGTY